MMPHKDILDLTPETIGLLVSDMLVTEMERKEPKNNTQRTNNYQCYRLVLRTISLAVK